MEFYGSSSFIFRPPSDWRWRGIVQLLAITGFYCPRLDVCGVVWLLGLSYTNFKDHQGIRFRCILTIFKWSVQLHDLIWGRNKTKFTPVHDPPCIRFHHIIYPCYFKSKDWFIRWSRLLFWMEFFQPEFCTHLFFGNRDGRYLFCNQTRGHQVISRRILPEFIMNSDQNSSRNAAKFSFLIFDRYVFFLFERIEITKIKISLNTSGPR